MTEVTFDGTDEDAVVCADSITRFDSTVERKVAVCGSHSGLLVGRVALALGVAGLVANDAGGGKENAGIAGLASLGQAGIPAVAVAVFTARIGDGADTYAHGVVSVVNDPARTLGITTGDSAREAASMMADNRWSIPALAGRSMQGPEIHLVDPGPPRILVMDSAGWINDDHRGAIVVTGSHGGTVAGRAVKTDVAAAVFNDAGVGRDLAGIGRLSILDESGIPGMTVSNTSARIGDGMDTYESGVLSHVNERARAMGVTAGDPAKRAIGTLQKMFSKRR